MPLLLLIPRPLCRLPSSLSLQASLPSLQHHLLRLPAVRFPLPQARALQQSVLAYSSRPSKVHALSHSHSAQSLLSLQPIAPALPPVSSSAWLRSTLGQTRLFHASLVRPLLNGRRSFTNNPVPASTGSQSSPPSNAEHVIYHNPKKMVIRLAIFVGAIQAVFWISMIDLILGMKEESKGEPLDGSKRGTYISGCVFLIVLSLGACLQFPRRFIHTVSLTNNAKNVAIGTHAVFGTRWIELPKEQLLSRTGPGGVTERQPFHHIRVPGQRLFLLLDSNAAYARDPAQLNSLLRSAHMQYLSGTK